MQSLRLRNLALICWISITTPATRGFAAAVDADGTLSLFSRDTIFCSGNSNLSYCSQGLPSTFCCPKGNSCINLNNTGTASALCCPIGNDCTVISPINCDVTLQDPTAHPDAPIHIADLTKTLPTCGSQCCPLGYECKDNACYMKDETKKAPTSTASSSNTASATTTSKPSSSATATQTSSPASIEPTRLPNKFPAGAVLAGLFPGIIIGVLLVLGILFLLKKRRDRRAGYESKDSSIFGGATPTVAKISEPIYQPGMSDRSDFTHARSASGNSIPPEQLPATSYGGFYKPNQRPTTGSTRTLVSPNQEKNMKALAPPFETPTRPSRPPQQARVRALFSQSPSMRSVHSSRKSRGTLGRSSGSLETIDVLMRPTHPSYGLPPLTIPPFQQNNARPQTPSASYADVYRAAGVSPPKSELDTRARPSVDTGRF